MVQVAERSARITVSHANSLFMITHTPSLSVTALSSQWVWSLSQECWLWNGNIPRNGTQFQIKEPWRCETAKLFSAPHMDTYFWQKHPVSLETLCKFAFRWFQWGGCWEFPIKSKRLKVFSMTSCKNPHDGFPVIACISKGVHSIHYTPGRKDKWLIKAARSDLWITWNVKHCQT